MAEKRAITRDSFDSVLRFEVRNAVFTVHRQLLLDAAPQFTPLLSDGNSSRTIYFPRACAQMFRYFQYWLYTNRILEEEEAYDGIPWDILTKLYLFAEERNVPNLQNDTINAILDKITISGELFPAEEIEIVYQKTTQDSPLRRLILDKVADVALHGDAGWGDREHEILPRAFYQDLTAVLCEKRRQSGESMVVDGEM